MLFMNNIRTDLKIPTFQGYFNYHIPGAYLCTRISDYITLIASGIKIWDVSIEECVHTLFGHTGAVLTLEMVGDGKLASGGEDKTVFIWNVHNYELIRVLRGHTGPVLHLTRLEGDILASLSADKSIRVWQTNEISGNLRVLTGGLSGEWHQMVALAGSHLATVVNDQTIAVFDWRLGERVYDLVGHSDAINFLELVSDNLLVSLADDGFLKMWNWRDGECFSTVPLDTLTQM